MKTVAFIAPRNVTTCEGGNWYLLVCYPWFFRKPIVLRSDVLPQSKVFINHTLDRGTINLLMESNYWLPKIFTNASNKFWCFCSVLLLRMPLPVCNGRHFTPRNQKFATRQMTVQIQRETFTACLCIFVYPPI